MQIIRSDNTPDSTQAVYTIPAGQSDAVFESAGRTFRAVRVTIFRDGYDGGVRGQDMSRKAWVFAVRQTRKGTDYVNGDGMHLGLDAVEVVPVDIRSERSINTEAWKATADAIVDAIVADGWTAELDEGSELDYRFTPQAPARDPWTPQTYREAVKARDDAAARIADLADERDALQRRIAQLEEQVVGYQQSLAEANAGVEAWKGNYHNLLKDWNAQVDRIKELEARPQLVAVPEAPRVVALGLEVTADHVQEADRLLVVDGLPVGPQAGDVENEDQAGLLVEHRQIHPRWSDCVEITVWFAGQMVSLAMDAGTKVTVRRPV